MIIKIAVDYSFIKMLNHVSAMNYSTFLGRHSIYEMHPEITASVFVPGPAARGPA